MLTLNIKSYNDDLTYDEYLSFSEKWIRNCFKWTKKKGRFCLNIYLDKNKGGKEVLGKI
mgnify:CR=1 FL=1